MFLTFLTQFSPTLPKIGEVWTQVDKMWTENLLDSWSQREVISGENHPIGMPL